VPGRDQPPTATVTYEVRLRRPDNGSINRHRWISYALQTPALGRVDDVPRPERPADEPEVTPVFRLHALGAEISPRLYWRDGEIVVLDAGDEWLSLLSSIASRLDADVVRTDPD
jgi:hypothetical protein